MPKYDRLDKDRRKRPSFSPSNKFGEDFLLESPKTKFDRPYTTLMGTAFVILNHIGFRARFLLGFAKET